MSMSKYLYIPIHSYPHKTHVYTTQTHAQAQSSPPHLGTSTPYPELASLPPQCSPPIPQQCSRRQPNNAPGGSPTVLPEAAQFTILKALQNDDLKGSTSQVR